MKLIEALKTIQQADATAPAFRVVLACGFTPLHLQTFLAAHLQQRLPSRRVQIRAGLYGDPAGTLASAESREADGVVIALEWFDLDARLGFRNEGNWGREITASLLETARMSLDRIAESVEALPHDLPTVIALPALRPAPLFHPPGGRLSRTELDLQKLALDFCCRMMERRGCAVLDPAALAEQSALPRFDLRSDLLTGFPYTVAHADALASGLARLLAPPAPKKGLISDLDDTLWRGIAGEIGAQGVRWDLAGHCQIHGLYQQLLGALADEGVLLAIASKNDPAVVEQALARRDLRIPSGRVFPIEVSWNAKSAAIGRILTAWNVGADSVVFVDDSPMELAEVADAHPGIECILFPKDDYSAAHAMLRRLRDLFGKPRLSGEDAIRVESLRANAAFQDAAADRSASEAFLAQANAIIRVEWSQPEDERALELVNKTNQFNLNGVRYSAIDWKRKSDESGAVLAVFEYTDRFGPLGKIAVVQGRLTDPETLSVAAWVMSCRAFSRRVEYQCMKLLFDRLQVARIHFEFQPTPRNGPLQDFFQTIAGERPEGALTIERTRFEERCPLLYHEVEEGVPTWT